MIARSIELTVAGLVRLARAARSPGPDTMPIWLTAALGLGASIVAGILNSAASVLPDSSWLSTAGCS